MVVTASASFYDAGDERLVSADRRTALLRFTLADVFQFRPFIESARPYLDASHGFTVVSIEELIGVGSQECVIVRSDTATVDSAPFQTLVEDLIL